MIKVGKAEFIKSAVSASGFYRTDKPVIAVLGKSNVGKSSFINMLARNGKLARTSNTPGRTRMINYFDFGPFVLADLPGYGFAKVSKAEKLSWAKLLDEFFAEKSRISHVFSLMDLRHEPTADDRDMVAYLNVEIIPFTVVATKADKIAKSKIKPAVRSLAACVGLAEGNVIAVSSVDGRGRDDVLACIENVISLKN